jgi:serine phosphatase RsbU (regulator of sigma subunit)
MVWTNAGHPPPILVRPDGSTELLEEHGPLFGFPSAVTRPRTDQRIDLAPGCTVVFYTDGLIERTGRDLDAGIDDLRAVLGERPAGGAHPVRATVDRAVTDLAPAARDDVVVLAIRISGAGRP